MYQKFGCSSQQNNRVQEQAPFRNEVSRKASVFEGLSSLLPMTHYKKRLLNLIFFLNQLMLQQNNLRSVMVFKHLNFLILAG